MASVNDYGGPSDPLNAPPLSEWAAAVAAVVNRDDTPVDERIAGAVVTDHGQLAGLGDDDHPHYALADGTRGDFAQPVHAHDYAASNHNHDGRYWRLWTGTQAAYDALGVYDPDVMYAIIG